MKNDTNAVVVGKVFYGLMKVIHGIEGNAYKVKIIPWKSKKPNLDILKYTKEGKYPEVGVGKYIYAVRHQQYREASYSM